MDSSDQENEFEGFEPTDIGDIPTELDNLSDIEVNSVSSVGTADLADFDSDPEKDIDNQQWTSDFSPFQTAAFTKEPGPILPDGFDTSTASPLDFFWLVFPLSLIRSIVKNTNEYAEFCFQRGTTRDRWEVTSESEMRAFIGANMMMGMNRQPAIEHYWSNDPILGCAAIKNTMSCNRFQKLSQFFHVANRSEEVPRGTDGYDRLAKVLPVMDCLLQTFRQVYCLGRNVAVDEAMIKYSGKLSFKQYMPAKPVKRGIKVWMLCDSQTYFLSKFEVYLGRNTCNDGHGLGYTVVTRLTDLLHHTHRYIFMDNYFTGVELMEKLLQDGLYACGTVRVNRKGFPAELKKPNDVIDRGDFKVLQRGSSPLTASVWMDNRQVHHLSMLSDPSDVRQCQRQEGANRVQLNQPHSVHSYGQNMGGVANHDFLRSKYTAGRFSRKWWKYLFWF